MLLKLNAMGMSPHSRPFVANLSRLRNLQAIRFFLPWNLNEESAHVLDQLLSQVVSFMSDSLREVGVCHVVQGADNSGRGDISELLPLTNESGLLKEVLDEPFPSWTRRQGGRHRP